MPLHLFNSKMTSSNYYTKRNVFSPYNYNDEVQQIPAVPQVGVWVEEQAVGYYLQERLHRKNNEE